MHTGRETTHDGCAIVCDDPLAQSLEGAIDLILSRIEPVAETETIATEVSLGRVLADPVVSGTSAPGWDNSAMDGYAIRHADLAAHGGRLQVAQRIPAGTTGTPLASGTAARIFTGAPVPTGADTVAIQEICQRIDDYVDIPLTCKEGANIRRAGEDVQAGSEVVAAGVRLAPQHLGLAASVGVAELQVYRRLRVAILASGDELVMPGKRLAPGQLYNSNGFTLTGLLQSLGCEIVDLGLVPDSLEATAVALRRGASAADLVIASGGVSVGEEDHLKFAVEQLGSLDFWTIPIRPGKPVAFGCIHGTPFFGSPGNPVALFVTFCLIARPLIMRLQGMAGDLSPTRVSVRAGFDWPSPDRRTEFHRGRLQTGADGAPELIAYPSRSSAVLSSVAWADGLIEIPPGHRIHKGDSVGFMPFATLF